jgi:hypothetical protein
MSVPNYGATTTGSSDPRTELSENYHWKLPYGEHLLDVSLTIHKVVPGVNFDIGQILRHDDEIVFSNGSTCPDHLSIEMQPDFTIIIRYRDTECQF